MLYDLGLHSQIVYHINVDTVKINVTYDIHFDRAGKHAWFNLTLFLKDLLQFTFYNIL